jgi:hypothetical protein
MKRVTFVAVAVLFFTVALFSHEYLVDSNPQRTWGFTDGQFFGSTQVTSLAGGDWDEGYYDLALPTVCQFYFYGRKVTHLRIVTDGYIIPGFGSPGGDVESMNSGIPDPSSPHPMIAVLWDDWDLSAAGAIWYRINDTAAAPFVIVEWRGVPHKDYPETSYDFAVAIIGNKNQELSDDVIFYYRDVDEGIPAVDFGASATVGIEHYAGTQGEEYSYDSASVADGKFIMFTPFVPIYDTTDAWGDGLPDPVIFRPSQGLWYLRKNDGSAHQATFWGTRGDVPLPGDYDGDGYWDILFYRPTQSTWHHYTGDWAVHWGQSGDIPVPADYDGNGYTDLAVFRPDTGRWFIYFLPGGTTASIQWGTGGDIPVPADYDNDGKADCAVVRPSSNSWYIRKSSDPSSYYVFSWGTNGDVPMPANLMYGAYSTACVYRPSTGKWFSYDQTNGLTSVAGPWGIAWDVPVPNDWNGDGITDAAVFRPIGGAWYISSGPTYFQWGKRGDKPRCRRSSLLVAPSPDGSGGR